MMMVFAVCCLHQPTMSSVEQTTSASIRTASVHSGWATTAFAADTPDVSAEWHSASTPRARSNSPARPASAAPSARTPKRQGSRPGRRANLPVGGASRPTIFVALPLVTDHVSLSAFTAALQLM
jgi:hypothetical protein